MFDTENQDVDCPYCGEVFQVTIDCSVAEQEYIEDCQVCCRPIIFTVLVLDNGIPQIRTRHEDEA